MAESRDDPTIHFVEPFERGVIPLETFHAPRRLQRLMRGDTYEVRINHDFPSVIRACAERDETWINGIIERLFCELHKEGLAHSVETYHEGTLVGGLYGLALGGAFCGESMFSTRRDASKVALCALVERLKERGFTLLDTQFITDHLAQFGATTIPQSDYLRRLTPALALPVRFD